GSATWEVSGRSLSLTNLAKLYWPKDTLTKGDMLEYSGAVAPAMLPYLENRPVTLRVYPNGIEGPSYYRRELPKNAPSWLPSVPYDPETTGQTIQLPIVADAACLLWLANSGGIEFHAWCSRADNLAEPDLAV